MFEILNFFKETAAKNPAMNCGDSPEKLMPEFWDQRSSSYAKRSFAPETKASAEKLLDFLAFSKDETALDTACGAGIFALPLAERIKKVTALDFSKGMLSELEKEAKNRGVSNIETVHSRWLDYETKETFDNVLAMNCLGVLSLDAELQPRLEETLTKLYSYAKKKLVILIPHADSLFSEELQQLMGLYPAPIERQRIAYFYMAMIYCGMLPELKILETPAFHAFQNKDEALEFLLERAEKKLSNNEIEAIKQQLARELAESDGQLILPYIHKKALYVATKN